MGRPQYERGPREVAGGIWAYLQPDGSWGWSNAGLVTGGGRSLLVDTLFDLRLTRDMLDALRAVARQAESIDMLVNTHANGDHCFGNQLLGGAEIIASRACAAEMAEQSPQRLAAMMDRAPQLGEVGAYLQRIFGAFDFHGITLAPPTRTFDGELQLQLGDRTVQLVEVGPAHTRGDVIVHVPDARTVFTGDILFIGGHPIMWQGPVENWIAACDRILALHPDTVVPGHGPVTDAGGVTSVRDYWVQLRDAARTRYDAGMPALDAARDIHLDGAAELGEAERLAINVATLYRQFSGDGSAPDLAGLFVAMAQLAG
jgi:glyoxylase-like metal-dependent hydrolase (beta-lactamase superfamily II)